MGNNPMMTVDPTGEIAWFVPIIVGAAIGGTAKGIHSANNGGTFFGGFWKGALIGAGAAAAGIGATAWAAKASVTAVAAGKASVGLGATLAGGAAGGFVSGSANAWVNGASFGDGLGAGLMGAALGAATAGTFYGLSKGLDALGRNGANKIINESREVAYASNGGGGVNPEYKINNITGKISKVPGAGRGAGEMNIYHVGSPSSNGGWSGTLRYTFGKNNIDVFRFYQSATSTISAFNAPGAGLTGYFLEPAGPSTTSRGLDRRIPSGQYNLDWHTRPSGIEAPRISNANVPKDRYILSHTGNKPSHTEGCFLPGCSWEPNRVWSSGKKLAGIEKYLRRIGIENVQLNVFDSFR